MRSIAALFTLGLLVMFLQACIPGEDDPYSDPVTKFLGTWKVNEDCSRMNYTVQIQADPGNSAQVLIYNLGNPGSGYDPAVGLVVSSSIYVNSQTIGEGWTIDGKGVYQSDGTIDWDYSLFIPPSQYDCSAVFSK